MDRSVHIIAFTKAGEELGSRLKEGFEGLSYKTGFVSGRSGMTHAQFARDFFRTGNVLIFIGAAGIAVRAIAPYVKDKKTDAAVIVMDEKGNFAVPILSGHIGEANHFAQIAAALTGGEPVLTTATDVNGLFAVDVLATRNHMVIRDMVRAKKFSAALLESRKADILIPEKYSDLISVTGDVPEEAKIRFFGEEPNNDPDGKLPQDGDPALRRSASHRPAVIISPDELPAETDLQLIPRCLSVGIGCRRGKSFEELFSFFKEEMGKAGLSREAVVSVCSIDLKKDEEGLVRLSEELDVPFLTFTADDLKAVEGSFTPSSFVADVTGVDNVCERAAYAASGSGRLLIKKTARDGMTLAVAMRHVGVILQTPLRSP